MGKLCAPMPYWFRRAHPRRAGRARERQAQYQTHQARARGGAHAGTPALLAAKARAVHALLWRTPAPAPRPRTIEVGSGPIGLISFFPDAGCRIGIDPLAHHYRTLYAAWPRRAAMCAAAGETLPFPDAAFDVVLCDNDLDHAERPEQILREIVRIARPGAVLYFTVNVHHPIYQMASTIHGAWNAVGIPVEIRPFADHTVHFTPARIRRLVRALPLTLLHEDDGVADAKAAARRMAPRHAGDRLKRILFKNARYVVVARLTP